MSHEEIILNTLSQPKDAIFAFANRQLAREFPTSAVFETEDGYFMPERPGEGWTFGGSDREDLWYQVEQSWWPKRNVTYAKPNIGWFEAVWREKSILMLRLVVQGEHCPSTRWFLIADDMEIAKGFFEEVCLWHSTVRGEILVFQEGSWHGDDELFAAIQGSSLDDLVLHGDLKDQIRLDIEQFFEQESMYERFRIPWKRGMLLLGPPGNGKTHMIRALANYFGKPVLYVKSFEAQYRSSQQCVATAFTRAREVAPCLLILEDLDTLLTGATRSFFLNEMDGFASNHGIVTIATCNFPEKLDAAITDRPSRFDRKYHFELPDERDRRRYLATFQTRFDDELQLDGAGLDHAASATGGYSYAYLKELCISSAVRWVSTDRSRSMMEVMVDQAATLRDQMTTEWAEPPVVSRPHGHYFSDEDEFVG